MENSLTKREQEILELVAKGCASKEIAPLLFISTATVNTHLKNIYGKLEVTNRIAALCKTGMITNYMAAPY